MKNKTKTEASGPKDDTPGKSCPNTAFLVFRVLFRDVLTYARMRIFIRVFVVGCKIISFENLSLELVYYARAMAVLCSVVYVNVVFNIE